MPLPFQPSEMCSFIPSGTSSLCDRFLKVFLRMPKLLCDFFSWAFNEDGTISDNFKNEVQVIPTGMIIPRASTVVPSGWLACNGQEVNRADYPTLFATIGTTSGQGNGTTTFNVPDLRGRTIFGYDGSKTEFSPIGKTGGEAEHVLTVGEMAHFHGFGSGIDVFSAEWCVRPWSGSVVGTGTLYLQQNNIVPSAALGSGRFGTSDPLATATPADPHNTLPSYGVAQYLIKT